MRWRSEEYYVYDPDNGNLFGYCCQDNDLVEIISWTAGKVHLGSAVSAGRQRTEPYRADGSKFATYLELAEAEEKERADKEQAQRAAEQAQRAAEQLRTQLQTLYRTRVVTRCRGALGDAYMVVINLVANFSAAKGD